ncbi:MAG: hypothetical protein KDK99_14370 [Verrucomicrobiales bacterium]|nr:hypothetical protein [Verrucomicrobiales bacterium]
MRGFFAMPGLVIAVGMAGTVWAAEARNWTNQAGQTVTAEFGGVEDGQVILILPNSQGRVPLSQLSAADQQWVNDHLGESSPPAGAAKASTEGKGAEGYNGPPALKEWPTTVALDEKGDATVLEENDETKSYRYESEHYEFVCDSRIGVATVREFSKVFEATWLANCLLPLDIEPTPERLRTKFMARIFTDKADYFKEGGIEGSAGVYMSGKKALMLPLQSLGVKMVGKRVSIDYGSEDYRTLIHEITHQMMNHWLGPLPTWYIEGAAEYVELAQYDNGRFKFTQQDNRLEDHLKNYGGEFPLVPLEILMNLDGRTWTSALTSGDASKNYASALALTYFFYHIDGDGKGTHFFEYMRGIREMDRPTQEKLDELTQTHLMRERDYATLEEELRKALRKMGVKCVE